MYSEQKQALAAELNFKHPAVLAVSGAKGCGKTTLLAALLPVLKARGLKVGVIRQAELDAADPDTARLHDAGAAGVAVFSAGRYLLTEEFRLNEQDLLALFERHSYDLVLLEGFNDSGWRCARSGFSAGRPCPAGRLDREPDACTVTYKTRRRTSRWKFSFLFYDTDAITFCRHTRRPHR